MEIPNEESATVEFKESSADLSVIIETLVAFSNALGGRIFIGVNDAGKIKGFSIGKTTLEELANRISQGIEPRIYPTIEKVKTEDNEIVMISVGEGLHKPYLYKGTGFKRVGKTNAKLDLRELENSILKKHVEEIAFDSLASEAEVSEINKTEIAKFVYEAKARRNQVFSTSNAHKTLENLNLVKKGKILNGALLCFGRDPQKFFPQFAFRCAVFRGGTIVNHQLIEGPLFQMIEEVQKFAITNMNRTFVIKGAKREDVFEYPVDAIREAVINAVIHRDYFSNSCCYLYIDEGRIEIRSPGLLAENLKVSDLKEPNHVSILRNKLIARAAYLSGYIEQWGIGTSKIVSLCRQAGLNDPVFEEKQGFFVVSIYNKKFALTAREKKALAKFSGKAFTTAEYAKSLSIAKRTAVKEIAKLAKAGLLLKKGKGKNTIYQFK